MEITVRENFIVTIELSGLWINGNCPSFPDKGTTPDIAGNNWFITDNFWWGTRKCLISDIGASSLTSWITQDLFKILTKSMEIVGSADGNVPKLKKLFLSVSSLESILYVAWRQSMSLGVLTKKLTDMSIILQLLWNSKCHFQTLNSTYKANAMLKCDLSSILISSDAIDTCSGG